ncbi:MAG: SDR family oxidoreductase [Chloroflexota bacterium]|nr:short-chain dehydrogenase [Chloroflexota bacterium]MCH2674150.1 SDR family oxidoreductase [Dehalococcoidia bacterium]MED5405168.1 SDR family oxidoreductase [Chloroflexota bacterium]MEE3250077.1 SDR family oxidoreductase [Chloroflexota bacterium]|tara:strand:+ start:231 stop:1079 length:849 start_codon:yes stop_codon:yes gene_type:complete
MQQRVLEGKIAIVTGAASPRGLGRAMTEALVRAGARVSMMDINQQWLDESSNYMREIGGDDCVMTQIVDVTSITEAERSIELTIKELGGLHILVNNAGIAPRNMLMGGGTKNNFWEVSPQEWDRVVAVNSSGPFYMTRTAVPHMLAQGWGRVIGVTTSMNTMYREGGTPYGPSKAAHEALVAMASRELEGTGVTVNVLVPGGMASTDLIPDDADHERANMIQPEVMQAPVVWLASDASDGINGQRFIGYYWNEELPLKERLEKAAAPAAWPQLGAQAIRLNQ